jgi:uncharacterized protein
MRISTALRVLAASLGLALAFAPPAVGQATPPAAAPAEQQIDPARLAAARELLAAAKIEETLTKTLPMMLEQMSGPMVDHFAGTLKDDAARETFRKTSAAVTRATQQQFAEQQGEVIEIVAKVYARSFTVEEMNAIAGFLRSPHGARFMELTPVLQRKVVELFTNLALGKPLPTPAPSDPAKLAAAREMFVASNLDATLDAMFATLPKSPVKEENAFIEGFKAKRGEIIDILAQTYAETFTVDEMNAVTTFYKSPEGVKLVQAMPAMLQETSAATADFTRRFAADLGKKIGEELRKVQQ